MNHRHEPSGLNRSFPKTLPPVNNAKDVQTPAAQDLHSTLLVAGARLSRTSRLMLWHEPLAVFAGRMAHGQPESTSEVEGVLKSHFPSDGTNVQHRVLQELLGSRHPLPLQEFAGRTPHAFAEQARQLRHGQPDVPGRLVQRQGVGHILTEKFRSAANALIQWTAVQAIGKNLAPEQGALQSVDGEGISLG